ncbi:MAG TPA: 16S rRNA (guanine(966)-N(2))-methyltransferase RsmD [Vicinamibacterales bacterium]|jgi:16S rRNA (guanine(966)-N(2))-methyltransferase RsmD|nr:16S rRNA (guanine(966)-N(2))-methyltransferase RsmD [Vicinamibacterales bacterium]
MTKYTVLLRVIAGSLKGRRLKAPTWDGCRPTSDKLRETLFNVLAPRIAGARVLDGYAGTGAIGIEALSRGARAVTFVDRDRRARALIADNLARCEVPSGCAIIREHFAVVPVADGGDVVDVFDDIFDIVLLDPPYDEPPDLVIPIAAGLLAADGVLVLEHAKRRSAPLSASGVARSRQIVSGDSMLSFYEKLEGTRSPF